MLAVSVDRIVWIDLDDAINFFHMGPSERVYCVYETELVKGFRKLLVSLVFLSWWYHPMSHRRNTVMPMECWISVSNEPL